MKQVGASYGDIKEVRVKQKNWIVRRLFSSVSASFFSVSLSDMLPLVDAPKIS